MTCDLFLAACVSISGPGAIGYSPILEQVAERRIANEWGLSADWREYEVLVATPNCKQLGKSGWLIAGGRVMTAKVVDCEADVHAGQMAERGLLVDASRRWLNHKAGWLVLR